LKTIGHAVAAFRARRWGVFAIAVFAAGVACCFWRLQLLPDGAVIRYRGTALIGNSRALAALDGHGTIIGLCWPHVGIDEQIYNPYQRLYEPEKTPLSTGAMLGIRRANGRISWLRDANKVTQHYLENSNVLRTRFVKRWQWTVEVTDWMQPDADLIIRHISVKTHHARRLAIVAYQNFDLAGTREADGAVYRDNTIVHFQQPGVAIAVASRDEPSARHLGALDSFADITAGKLNGAKAARGDVITAGVWPCNGELTLIYAIAPTEAEAVKKAREAALLPAGELRRAAIADTRSWLARGRAVEIPDRGLRDIYTRSLLVLRLLRDRDTGAVIAGARSHWSYCWPRDGVFSAAAFDLTGHRDEAAALYRFLASRQRSDGCWEPRYQADGRPVDDGRATQLDASGYFTWGAWLHVRLTGDQTFAREMYPAVTHAANHVLSVLHPKTGLPGPGSDYWESSKQLTYYLSNAVVCRAGLLGAAKLAEQLGDNSASGRWRRGAARIGKGIDDTLWDDAGGFYRRATEEFPGVDSAACWAISPFGGAMPDDARLAATVSRVEKHLTTRRGGIQPGEDSLKQDPWLPETAFVLLYTIARGDHARADYYFRWLADAATPAATLPERISARTGLPDSTTPLGWSHAMFILAVTERWGSGIPKPGAARSSSPSPSATSAP